MKAVFFYKIQAFPENLQALHFFLSMLIRELPYALF
jgi:hypothetical protein